MTLQIDTREKKKELARIEKQLDGLGVDHFRSKLFVGDYCNIDNPRVVIDRKKDLLELCGNVCQQHDRFKAELVRAKEKGFKIIILCEHGAEIQRLSDVFWWNNPRLKMTKWIIVDGKSVKVRKYPRAITGQALYKSLCTIRDKYGVEFQFCAKDETGAMITRLLEK